MYWSGVTVLFRQPAAARPRLEHAFEQFTSRSKTTWMLLAWAGVVDSIFLHYRDLRELDPWIEWMTPELESAVDKLPQSPRSLVVSSMLFALAFRQPNHPRMDVWRHRAECLIELDPVSDLGARLSSGLITDYTWKGNLEAAQIVLSRFRAHASRKQPSPLATVLGYLNDATLSLHQGKLEQCMSAVASGLDASAGHGVRIWEGILRCHAISASCSLGEIAQAHSHIVAIEQLFAESVPVDEAYYRGMLFWYAFVSGDHIGALSRCTSALETVDAKGVPYLQAACRVGVGLTLFEGGHREQGEALLNEGLRIGREICNPLLEWMGQFVVAHMEFAKGNAAAGDAALEKAMRLGRDHSMAHFFCWPRQVITQLLDRALERGYSPDYAQYLIARHRMVPGERPTRSDRWAFEVRIYTFGQPRIEYADGRIEHLSVQFQRQIELLAALIGKEGRPTPLHTIASDVYQDEDVDAIGSIKRILHSLRERLGHVVVRHNASLALDFSYVWIDACTLQRLLRETDSANEVEIWLREHYRGHFMDCVESSANVLGVRQRICDQVESVLREVRILQTEKGDPDSLRKFEARWGSAFPSPRGLSKS
jgi:LuxR family transcriptional regulator, maltose regulon positive regulatory protein